jgi:hypothetical protein
MAIANGKAVQEYRSHFGEQPGSREASTEQVRWQQLCQKLLEQRDCLRQELTQARDEAEQYRRALQKLLPIDCDAFRNLGYEEAKALAVKEQSFDDLITDSERGG